MIRNGNICFVPTRLAAPEICDREVISGLSVSPVALTMAGGTYQTDCGSFWLHLFLCVNLQANRCTLKAVLVDFQFCTIKLRRFKRKVKKEKSGVSGFEFDFKSTQAGHGSSSSNHSFIMPAEREVMGVSSRRIGELSADSRRGTWRPVQVSVPWRLVPRAAAAGQLRVKGTNGRLMAQIHSCQITCQCTTGTASFLLQPTINLGPVEFIPLPSPWTRPPQPLSTSAAKLVNVLNFHPAHWASTAAADFQHA